MTAAVVHLAYPGCLVAETQPAIRALRNAGHHVVTVAPSAERFVDAAGVEIDPVCAITDVDPDDVDLLLVPGGDPEVLMGDESVRTLVREVFEAGGALAGICAGVLVLADSGVLQGTRITHNYRAPWAPPEVVGFVADYWAGARVEHDTSVGVVVDGTIITALPDAVAEFSLAVVVQAAEVVAD